MGARILVGQVKHETNTFSRLPTDLDSYARRLLVYGDDMFQRLAGTRTEIGGFLQAARRNGWTLVPTVAADATPSGKVTAAAWTELSGTIVDGLERAGKVDGVLLALHGAMVTEDQDDGEGDLLARIRARVGPDVPVIATLDLHANVTDAMASNANALIAYRTYPHVDHVERAEQAAALMQRTLAGEVRPVSAVARRATLDAVDHGRTHGDPKDAGPMDRILAEAARIEGEPGVLAVSVHAGFGWADIRDAGPSVAVAADGDRDRARSVAETLIDAVQKTQGQDTVERHSLAEAIAEARRRGDKPLVLADFTDNPGGGGYGDATRLLGAMIDAGLVDAALHAINDPDAVRAGQAAGTGAEVTLDLGGKIDPAYGAPLRVTGRVARLTDGSFVCDGPMHKGVRLSHGPTMVLAIGGIDVIVTSNRMQTTDLQAFLSQGIDPRRKSVLALKSSQHFRAAFAPIARKIMLADGGALCSPDYRRFAYRKLRRPIWPLDPA
ncbi:MAG: M81 family metallopeptidase [Alphaproteobacteria bacterium]|nr:M81 family metallopeptidase [Alphaproteobacteria bacterium]